MQKCDSRRRDGLVRSEPVVSRCAKRHLGAAASRRSSRPPSDGGATARRPKGNRFSAPSRLLLLPVAPLGRVPFVADRASRADVRAAPAASPGGSRSPQHGRTDCSLSLRAAVSGMSSVTVALTQERSPRGRADGSIHLLLAWKRKRDRAAIAREDAGAALLRAFQISALASRGPTARHCRNRRKDGMGTTAFPSWCGQRGLIGSSDDDRGDRNSACAPRRCGCALRVGAVVQVRRSGARRARPTVALPRTCERQTHCVAPPRPSVAAAARAVGPSACG